MIIRVFRARLKPGKRAEYERLCRMGSFPVMRRQPGCLAVSIAEPKSPQSREFIVVSVWRSLDDLRAFVGEQWREVLVLPGEADLLEVARVEHYDESYSSLIDLWEASAEVLKRREATALAVALTDAQWEAIRPLLPPPARTGRPRAEDRSTLEGVLYVLRNGCRWQDVPERYGDGVTCWRRFVQWEQSGVWAHIWSVLLTTMEPATQLSWALTFLDHRSIPSKPGRKYGAWAAQTIRH